MIFIKKWWKCKIEVIKIIFYKNLINEYGCESIRKYFMYKVRKVFFEIL